MDATTVVMRVRAVAEDVTPQDVDALFDALDITPDPVFSELIDGGAAQVVEATFGAVMGMMGPEDIERGAKALVGYVLACGVLIGRADAADMLDGSDIPDPSDW